MKRVIKTDSAVSPRGPYAQAVHAGDYLFISGTVPVDPKTDQVVEARLDIQTRQVFDNIKAIVEAAGGTMDDLVMVTPHLRDVSEWAEFNAVYRTYFTDYLPARMTFEGRPPLDYLVDVDAIAYLPQ